MEQTVFGSRECTWCRIIRELYSRDMAAELTDYIASLPREIKVSEEEHERRLAICRGCGGNMDGLCRYCGCYIAARTVKKGLSCPHPAGGKWSGIQDEEEKEITT